MPLFVVLARIHGPVAMSATTHPAADTRTPPRRPPAHERTWAPSQLGRNGNPPPYDYQRRLDHLGTCPKRSPRFRTDWLEAVATYQRAGHISAGAVSVAHVLAERSNAHGKDLAPVSEAHLGRQLHKVSGSTYSAKYASDRLDELRAAGLLDWEHGQESQRWDDERRQLLGGRWQGACRYRLLVPDAYAHALAERRRKHTSDTRRHHRSTRPGRTTTPTEPRHPDRRDQARSSAAAIARNADTTTFEAGVAELEEHFTGELYEVAYDEFTSIWRRERDGP